MTTSNTASSSLPSVLAWRMPIMLANYPDRSPTLTVQEKALMDRYITTPIGALSRISTSLLAQLKRFDQPFLETVRLTNHTNQKVTPARRLLFQQMMQTGLAFWTWPKDVWIEVIETYPSGHIAGGIKTPLKNSVRQRSALVSRPSDPSLPTCKGEHILCEASFALNYN